jgi:hypothetical protein
MSSLCFVHQLLTNHYQGNPIKKNEMVGVYGRKDAYRVLVQRPEGKRLLKRPRHRWKDNIKINVQEMGWGGMNWIGCLLVNVVLNLQAS